MRVIDYAVELLLILPLRYSYRYRVILIITYVSLYFKHVQNYSFLYNKVNLTRLSDYS